MNKLFFASTTSLLTLGTVLVVSSCDQPPVLCTCGRGDFAAVYTFVSGTDCGIKSEILGMNAYNPEKDGPNTGSMADWWQGGSVAIGSERIGRLIDRGAESMVSDPNPAHKLYVVGNVPTWPTNDFCAVPQMKTPDAEIDMPAIPAIPDDPVTTMVDESKPAVEATHYVYKWSNVELLVRPDAIGTQMRADLDYTKNNCTGKYRVKAVYPARDCESTTTPGQPDPELCNPASQPEKGIFFGSGISPDFPVACVEFDPAEPMGAKRFFCMLTKEVPAFK